MGAKYSFYVKTIETHACAFLTLNILATGRVHSHRKRKLCQSVETWLKKKLVKSQVQNLPFVPEFEELLRFPSIFAFLASKQQIGVKRNNFSAARPWISGCLMVGLWLGKNAVWGIRCLKISQSITSSQFKPIKVSKKDKDTADSYKK